MAVAFDKGHRVFNLTSSACFQSYRTDGASVPVVPDTASVLKTESVCQPQCTTFVQRQTGINFTPCWGKVYGDAGPVVPSSRARSRR